MPTDNPRVLRIERRYNEIKKYINEGDVLLYRGSTFVSRLISTSSGTPYSHVGVASWVDGNSNTEDGILECVDFREGFLLAGLFGLSGNDGGRSVNLNQQVKKFPGQIDVYRPNPVFFSYFFDEITKEFTLIEKQFDGKAVTRIMRRMTGLPYGWKKIWWMIKYKLWILDLFKDKDSLICDTLEDIVYPVCSTVTSYAFNQPGFDLVHNRSDEWTEPGDIAKSSGLNYWTTLIP
jgi:hypothetical protein